MDERIAITFGGRQLGVSQVSGLPREASVALLIELAALQSAIAAQLWLSVSHVGTLEKAVVVTPGNQAANGAVAPASQDSTVAPNDAMHSPVAKAADNVCLTVKQTAARLGVSPWTIYHWIESGKLGEARGLRKFGSRRLIDWQVFKACLARGELK